MSAIIGFIILLTPLLGIAMPAEERKETRILILDRANEFFGQRVNRLANDFDSFFATERADDELGRSRLRISSNYRVEERSLPSEDIQFRFNLKLPHLEQKFKIKPREKGDGKTTIDQEEVKEKVKDYLSKRNRVDERWLFNADANVNASIHPSLRVRGRIRKSLETGTLVNRFVQEISWISTRDGFRNKTTLSTDQNLSEGLLFRFNNSVDWKISQKNFSTGHGPSIFHRLSDFDAMSYGIGLSTTVLHGIWFVSSYNISPTYRRNLYKDMLFFDFTPGLLFPKKWSFRRTPFAFAQIELLFGDS